MFVHFLLIYVHNKCVIYVQVLKLIIKLISPRKDGLASGHSQFLVLKIFQIFHCGFNILLKFFFKLLTEVVCMIQHLTPIERCAFLKYLCLTGSGIITRDELSSFYSSVLGLDAVRVGQILDLAYQAMTSVNICLLALSKGHSWKSFL